VKQLARLLAVVLCALTTAAQTPEAKLSPDEVIEHARQTYIQQGPKAALPEFERALATSRSSKDRRREAITLGYMGNCYRRLGDLPRALSFVQRGITIKQELGDKLEIGKSHNQLGLIYWDMADYGKAIAHFQLAIAVGQALNDRELQAQAHNNLGLVYDEKGDFQRSQEQYGQALKMDRAAHDERGEGDTLANIGGVHLLLGEYREALGFYQQAMVRHERLGLIPTTSIDLGNMGICYTAIGETEKALATFDKALDLAQKAALQKEQADWHKGKGEALLRMGKFGPAMQEYDQAQKVYERAGLKRELVEALNDTGNLYLMLGDAISGEKNFWRALELSKAIGNDRGITLNLMSLGDLESRRKRHLDAENFYRDALSRARKTGNRENTAGALVELALDHHQIGQLVAAEREAREALEAAQAAAVPPAEARAYYALAEIERSSSHFDAAIQRYSAAAAIDNMAPDPDLDWRVAYGRGQSLEKLGRNREALAAYKQAVATIEDVRSKLAEERFRSGYIDDKYQVFVVLVELLLKLQQPDEAFSYSERLRAHSFLEQFSRSIPGQRDPAQRQAEAELRERIRQLRRSIEVEWSQPVNQRRGQALDTFSKDLAVAERAYQDLLDGLRRSDPSYAVLHALTVPATAEVQKLLPPKTALVEYVIAKNKLAIFILTSKRLRATTVPISAESLQSRVELLRDLIRREGDDWRLPAAGLRRVLINPLDEQGWLKAVQRLYIVPNGVLNYVPFAALPRTVAGTTRFLVDDYVLGYLPSAAVLTLDHKGPVPDGKLLAMAPERAHLKYADQEVRDVSRFFAPQKLVLTGRSATKSAFERSVARYQFVHLATHGYLNRYAPLLSGLQLEANAEDDGLLEVHEILGLNLHTKLVTLSACETALGSGYFSEAPAGDELVGLTRAFLTAGSQTVLASLWEVNDRSTLEFMVDFYRRLPEQGEAGALTEAQRAMRAKGGRYGQPYFWAPFVLVGQMN